MWHYFNNFSLIKMNIWHTLHQDEMVSRPCSSTPSGSCLDIRIWTWTCPKRRRTLSMPGTLLWKKWTQWHTSVQVWWVTFIGNWWKYILIFSINIIDNVLLHRSQGLYRCPWIPRGAFENLRGPLRPHINFRLKGFIKVTTLLFNVSLPDFYWLLSCECKCSFL